ncbi:MAG: DUF3794 domain-containing protein [Ruminococcaceae bacterium]|nr:DUF3794 domain-containing protein [Oscillospiraceae bacterium]
MTDEKRGYLALPIYERTFGIEASGDFTLPDYQSEIRRILCVSAVVLPPAKYVSDSAIEFNGTVDYQVIYVGGDGNITSASLPSEYAFSVPLDRSEEINDVRVLCSVGVESVSSRVSAPRRLGIRARLRPSVRAYGMLSPERCSFEGADPTAVYKNFLETETLWCASSNSDTVNVSCVCAGVSDDTAVAFADTSVEISEVSTVKDRLLCRGAARLRLLCTEGEIGKLRLIETEVPFDGEIDVPNMPSEATPCVRGIVADTSVNVGDTGIECSMGIVLSAEVFANERVEYVSDAYSTERECDAQTKNACVRRMLIAKDAEFSLNERVSLADASIPPTAEILFAHANAYMDRCSSAEKKATFTGKADFSVAWRNDEEISVSNVSIPLKYELATDTEADVECFDSYFEVKNPKAMLEGGQLSLGASLVGYVNAVGKNDVQLLDRVSFGDAFENAEACLVICYPSDDDTEWSVAKRYRTSPKSVIGNPETDRFILVE